MVTEAKPVTLKDVQGAYYALGILVFAAACILMIEQVLRSRYPQDSKESDMLKSYASGGYTPNGYISNGHLANGDAKGASNGVTNGYVTNGYTNGVVVNGTADKYGRDISQYTAKGDIPDKKEKKKKKDKTDMESGAPVFSKSLWS